MHGAAGCLTVVPRAFRASPRAAGRGLWWSVDSLPYKGPGDGINRSRLRPALRYEVRLVPTRGGALGHPYRTMDEDEREALLLDCLLRIERDSAGAEPTRPAPMRRPRP